MRLRTLQCTDVHTMHYSLIYYGKQQDIECPKRLSIVFIFSVQSLVFWSSNCSLWLLDFYRPRSLEIMHLVASVCPFVCLCPLSRPNHLTNRSHYQSEVFVCVSVISKHIRIIVRMRSIGVLIFLERELITGGEQWNNGKDVYITLLICSGYEWVVIPLFKPTIIFLFLRNDNQHYKESIDIFISNLLWGNMNYGLFL